MTDFRPCLLVMNARQIPDCIASYAALDIPRAMLTGYTERELVPVFADVIASTDYTHYLAVSDDAVVTRDALDAVLDLLERDAAPVATGWSNLDSTLATVNLTRSPLLGDWPVPEAYDFYHWSEVLGAGPVVPTFMAGMCLTGMSRGMWREFPFACFGSPEQSGFASDFHLCLRLQEARVPIVAARGGFCFHVKERIGHNDVAEDRRMYIGPEYQRVTIVDGVTA